MKVEDHPFLALLRDSIDLAVLCCVSESCLEGGGGEQVT